VEGGVEGGSRVGALAILVGGGEEGRFRAVPPPAEEHLAGAAALDIHYIF
jgi:hypothetical protein